MPGAERPLFTLRDDIDSRHPLIAAYEAFLDDHRIEIAGIEFIETTDGRLVTYDVNTNTNYNPDIELLVPQPAASQVARFLGELLADSSRDVVTGRVGRSRGPLGVLP